MLTLLWTTQPRVQTFHRFRHNKNCRQVLVRESFFPTTNMQTSPNLCVKLQSHRQYEKTCGPQGIVWFLRTGRWKLCKCQSLFYDQDKSFWAAPRKLCEKPLRNTIWTNLHLRHTTDPLRWLNTVLAVCEYMSFTKSWQEKGCSSQAETWQVKNILMKNFDWQVKFDVFVVSMATWTIEYNLKISLLLSLHKIRSLDFPINLHTAYYN